jgi:carboxymethylenebutenolidase
MLKTTGSMVEFKFKAGNDRGRGYVSVPETSRGGVLVLHAWWGLNDFFKGLCDKLAKEGYTAFAPDLRQGKIARTVSEAKDLMSKSSNEVTQKTILGGLDYLFSHPTVKSRRIAVLGFSMGANWALWLSTEKPSEVAAVVAFYGTGDEDFSKSRSSYLGHYSPDDEWEPINDIRSLEEKIRQAGRPVTFHLYPGAKHWFFEDNQPDAYDPSAARIAWTRTLEFLHPIFRKTNP